jgi:dolichol-phosphate mannosyltransferase
VRAQTESTWLVIPTYDEAENIEPLTEAVRKVLPSGSRILIVDDSSPDGTGEIADRLATEHEDVKVLHRPAKGGLGPAYLAGFRRALEQGADLIVQMDADFSHDPAYLPRFLDAARNADLVLGSRYVPGGGVSEWGPLRRFISRGGSAYGRAMLAVKLRDLTGGY